MPNAFSDFSFNKMTDSIASAAHKTQTSMSSAFSSASSNLSDPRTKLSFKSRTRKVQESLGTVSDISKLPPQYLLLERKTDALEKICKRILTVTKTYEIDGYDYPPNFTESISDWWSIGGKNGWFASKKKHNPTMDQTDETKTKSKPKKDEVKPKKDETKSKKDEPKAKKDETSTKPTTFFPKSFSQAISKASSESENMMRELEEIERKEAVAQNKTAEGFEDEEEDEHIENFIKLFESWSQCYKSIDERKSENDALIVKEFNKKLENFLSEDFKHVHALRKKVQDSRLEFDTMRYEVKAHKEKAEKAEKKEQAAKEKKEQAAGKGKENESGKEKEAEPVTAPEATATEVEANAATTDSETVPLEEPGMPSATEAPVEANAAQEEGPIRLSENDTEPATPDATKEELPKPKEDEEEKPSKSATEALEDAKLLEQLEDEFVSNITTAVETMESVTDSYEFIGIIKLFQNFQLAYLKQSVEIVETNLKVLDNLEK